ncbi:SAM-dependent methyltransferase [Nonomuraea longicatena]|uniref:S-adenosyl methyltransferase n=1 Tax=Nonomuraea longicatena TaxID=83682 RepID=A0ABN1PW25_9ACTN
MTNIATTSPPAHWIPGDLALHPALDRSRPNAARVHNCLLGERDNSLADRRVAATLEKCLPGLADAAWAVRRFALEAVRTVAGLGFGLFVDLGCGYPLRETVHGAALAGDPGARVLYVDHDPVVVAHARALLAGGDAVQVMRADVRGDLGRVLDHPRVRLWIDFGEPVVVVMAALAEHLTDGELADVLDTLLGELPGGSVLIFTQTCDNGLDERRVEAAAAACGETGAPLTLRPADRVRELFSDGRWSWAEASFEAFLAPGGVTFVGGIATVCGRAS